MWPFSWLKRRAIDKLADKLIRDLGMDPRAARLEAKRIIMTNDAKAGAKLWRKEMKMNNIKPGLKTTEFWLGLLSTLLTFVAGALGWDIPVEAIVSVAGIVLSYIFGRSHVKAAASKADAARVKASAPGSD